MFCKLAFRHVITYSNSTPEDGKKLEKSGIIIELMRMRDFCFVLKDRAKAALDVAIIMAGDPNGAAEVPLHHEYMKYHGNMSAPPPSSNNDEPRADFGQAFETTFAKPITATNWNSAQPNTSITQTQTDSTDPITLMTAPGVQHLPDPSSQGHDDHESHISFEAGMENIISHPVIDSQEFTAQEETGLWNWWDLVEMDFEGNTQVV